MPLRPQESWTLLLMPPALLLLFPTPSFPFSTHTYRRCFFMLFRRSLSMLYFVAHTFSTRTETRALYTCESYPTPERPGASQPSAGNSQIYRGLPLTSSRDRR